MSVSVSCSLAYVEQRRSTCNASRSFSVERFASQRVSVGVPNRIASDAVRWPARSQNRLKTIAKIDSWRGPGRPKSIQNRFQDPLGTPRGAQERPRGVSGASRERLGSSPACPGSDWRVPKGAPGRQKECPGAPRSAPRRPKSMPSRVSERKN